MEKRKLCLAVNEQFGKPVEEQIFMILDAGYDGVFFPYRNDDEIRRWTTEAKAAGMETQSLHAPFVGCRALWEEDADAAQKGLDEISGAIRAAARYGAPIVVSHVFIGFDLPPIPMERGLERYYSLIRLAEAEGVRLAFENTEGEEYLQAIFNNFGDNKAVGFCLDTGHELCYNRGKDLTLRYGKKLIATHINDNLGISDKNGRITWLDDLHLLPFDGVRDWAETARRFARIGFAGPLTFELNTVSKPGRHENDKYGAMSLAEYLAESFRRAIRFREMVEEAETASS